MLLPLAQAQLQATLNVDSNPTPELSEWVNRNNLAILTVTNPVAGLTIDYQIKVSLLLDGDVKLTTDRSVPYMTADLGTETFLADELIPYTAVQFIDAKFKDKVSRTGMLPPGSYSFCVELLDQEGRSLTQPEQICRPMIITDYQMPELLSPVDDKVIDPLLINSLMFQWTPLVPVPDAMTGITYLIAVSEVQPGQTPSQAFSVNYPIIEEEVTIGTQFIWPLDIPAPDEDQQYVWGGIKPMTREGNTYREKNNGFVDYGVFTVRGNNKSGDEKSNNNDYTSNNKDQRSNDDLSGDNKNPKVPITWECEPNPFTDGNDLFFSYDNKDNGADLELNGLMQVQNQFLSQYPGAISLSQHQLITYIDWGGCDAHNMEMIAPNTSSVRHDYNTNDHQQTPERHDISTPDEVTVHFKLINKQTGESCDVQVSKKLTGCDFPSQDDFEDTVEFVMDPDQENYPLNVYLDGISDFTEELDSYVYDSRNTNKRPNIELFISYDSEHEEEPIIDGSPRYNGAVSPYPFGDDGTMQFLSHNYSLDCMDGTDIQTEICLTYVTERKIDGEIIICQKTYCIPLPDETIEALIDLYTKNEDAADTNDKSGEEECACLDDSTVTIPELEMRYSINDAGDEQTLYIVDSDVELQKIINCMTTTKTFDSTENVNNDPEFNHQSQFFTGTVTHDWDDPNDLIDTDYIHTYNTAVNDISTLPQFVTVTFTIVNPNAGINCTFTKDVPLPTDDLNMPDGTATEDTEDEEDCECDLTPLVEPIITIEQLEPDNYPRKLSLTNITELRDYLMGCKSSYNSNPGNYTIETTINWDSDHDDAAIQGNNAFEHQYGAGSHEIPEEICITYTISPIEGIDGEPCVKEYCIDVPSSFQDLNTSDTATNSIAVGETINAGYTHEFEVEVTEVAVDSTNQLTGKGFVEVGWLGSRVAVEFTEITIDSNNNLLTGKILGQIYEAPAPVYPTEWGGMEVLGNGLGGNTAAGAVEDWVNPKVADVVEWVNSTSGDAVDWVNSTAGTTINAPQIGNTPQVNEQTTPVKLPLGVNYANGDQFAITEMVFRPNLSEFNLVAAKNTPPSWQGPGEDPQLIGFIAKNIKFHPSSVETPPERLELLENVTVGNMNNKITFEFISPSSNPQGGCYIEWDENGFSQFGIELESTFTRDWLVPVPDNGSSRTTATFQAIVQDWNDMVLTGNLDECEIVDSQGMTISAGNISFDMSDTLNPNNLQAASDFPSNYTGENTVLFRGFHMEQLTVGMPTSWQTNNNGVPQLSIYDMIINDTGITMVAEAENVAGFRGANVADLIASIDTVRVDIRSSSFHDAYVKGRIGLPVSKADSIQNPLAYKALFTTATTPSSFQLTIEPTGPINANL
ncbi:hypothetical protein JCM19298_2135 [Nonlabens ulvanivorans]|nr:hypothetical protein JCM19298_2135 [Nonlabens ulvanivorans]